MRNITLPGRQAGFIGALLGSAARAIGGALINRGVDRISRGRTPRTLPGGSPAPTGGGLVFDPTALGTSNQPAGSTNVVPSSIVSAGAGGLVTVARTAGRFVGRNRARVAALARVLGVAGAATALGVGVVDVADAVVRSKPRQRGITARQFANAKRVNRKVLTMACQLSDLRAKTKRACK